jgi:hypothetical protein
MAGFAILYSRGDSLRAEDSVPAVPASTNVATASLTYHETAYSVINWAVGLTPRTAPFSKEPAVGSGKICRGVLNTSGHPSNSIAFLWQRDTGKLFLDLNRNQDLSDDPTGVFWRPPSGRPHSPPSPTFTCPFRPLPATANRWSILLSGTTVPSLVAAPWSVRSGKPS